MLLLFFSLWIVTNWTLWSKIKDPIWCWSNWSRYYGQDMSGSVPCKERVEHVSHASGSVTRYNLLLRLLEAVCARDLEIYSESLKRNFDMHIMFLHLFVDKEEKLDSYTCVMPVESYWFQYSYTRDTQLWSKNELIFDFG